MLGSADLAREIQALEAKSASIRSALDSLMQPAREELAAAAVDWVNKTLASEVSSHSSLVVKMDPGRIRALKERVAELVASYPRVVASLTNDADEWPHRRRQPRQPELEPYFNAVFRAAISMLGPVLEGEGFLEDQPRGVHAWQRGPQGLRYAVNSGFDIRQHGALTQYAERSDELQRIGRATAEKRTELEKAKARELWESA